MGVQLSQFAGLQLILLLGTTMIAGAIPRFSLLSGTRCSACHFNPSGGGLRNVLGWSMTNETGLWRWDSVGVGALAAGESNDLFEGLVTVGFDGRLQLARLGRPRAEKLKPDYRAIPMQMMPYVAIDPVQGLSIYGGYNLAGPIYRARGNATFPGQSDYEAAIQYQPDYILPIIRAGMIAPSIGIRYDDHTVFVRREVASPFRHNLIPPNFNELGVEVTYEGLHWLTLNAGVFNAKHLAEVEPSIGTVDGFADVKKPSYLARVMLWPQLLDDGFNGELGASIFMNGDFRMVNAFAGIGKADSWTIQGEALYSTNVDERQIRNVSLMGSYQLAQWLALEWRYEYGQTELTPAQADLLSIQRLTHAHQFVLGAQFFPFPWVELRPEYRYFQTDEYILGQYTVQMHLFY